MKTKIKLMQKIAMAILLVAATFAVQAQEALTLDKALIIAETGSPDLKLSLLNLERYQKNLEAQRAALKSRFSLQVDPVNYSKQRRFDNRVSEWYTNENFETSTLFTVAQPILVTDGTISLTNEFGWSSNNSSSSSTESEVFFNNLYLNLNQPLFTYNSLKLELKELELNFENARISYAMQYLNLEKNVTEFFYNVYMAQMNLAIAKDELANTQKSYDIIKNKVEAGLAAKEEEYQAELNLASAKSTLQNSEVTFENAKDQLKLYLGMDLFEDIMILADVSVNPVPVDLDKAIENGLNSRMELRQREIDVETSQFDLIRTKAQNEFRGDMNLRFGITGDNGDLGNIYQNPTKSPSVGISFNIPIFDWGERKARIAAAEASIQSQELNLNEERNQIVVDIRQVYRNIQNQLNQIDLAEQNERNAQLTYEINLERYENGDLTGMDLNLYQNQLSTQKVALSQALINYKIELLNLKIQSLYDFEKNEAIIPSELYSIDNKE
ncbi:TolC family protein [Draconibacterium sp. IB214405]|uniref:TolC family protein n=1 Tax=Draconibacterium sp. IB214405 TaxID=3097352 RepID=UPI002A12DDAE|nr:TolC family protein [Draconibacterium sp. IB214405]MDX8338193.1 TolC family protein [Draconibacterium sp. IB214405]